MNGRAPALPQRRPSLSARVGDFGFILGLFLVWYSFGSLDYATVFAQAQGNWRPRQRTSSARSAAPGMFR